MSSAKNLMFDVTRRSCLDRKSGRSLIKRRNNSGHNTLPFGTALVTGTKLEITPSILEHCKLLVQNSRIHMNKLSVIPNFDSLKINLLCTTESNAFDKSKNIISMFFLASNPKAQSVTE